MNDAILTMEAADDPLKAEAVPGPCPPAASDPKRPYTVGTLRYSLSEVIVVSAWVILGGTVFGMLGSLVPTLLPLTLEHFGASDALIGLVVGSVPAAMNFVMNPILSTASDRTRTRRGRRIPYLLFATPFVTFFLILIGWISPITGYVHANLFPEADINTLGVLLICIFSVVFQFFNLIVGSIYYYIFADVIPHRFIGRFMAALNLAGTAGGFLFNFFVMPYIIDYAPAVFTGIGLLYLVCFLLMCFFVKEGEYPPPKTVRRPEGPLLKRPAEWIGIYFRQCYRHWFFTFLFLGTALNNASTVCRSTFNLLFATRELQMTAGQFGKVMAAGAVVSAGVVVLTGFLMDRLHPLRVFVASGVIVVAANVWGYFGVVDYPTFFVVGIAISVVYAVQFVSNGPVFIELFPPDKFGQFSSANAMMNSILLIFANYFGGVAIDRFGYRFIFIWDTIFTVAATLALLFVYVRWKQLGGPRHYAPPPTD